MHDYSRWTILLCGENYTQKRLPHVAEWCSQSQNVLRCSTTDVH